MNKQNKTSLPTYAREGASGSNRAENFIPGTRIPENFYITIKLDMEKLLTAPMSEWDKQVKNEFNGVLTSALKRIQEFRLRYRYFKCYKVDVGDGFQADYNYAWCIIDDGTIQLLRLDMIPLGERAINAEMDWFDGKLEEVIEDGITLLKPTEKTTVVPE